MTDRITTERCCCGHPKCRDTWLVGIGKFVQGSGFTPEEADRVVRGLRALDLVEENEWSGSREGPGYGPHGSGDGPSYSACLECGGLEKPNGDFIEIAVGHRSGCTIADLLGRETVVEIGETGSLAL